MVRDVAPDALLGVVASAVDRGNVTRGDGAVLRPVRDVEAYVDDVRPRLLRALAGAVGASEAADATAEAIAYAFEHWDRISTMDNPTGYLFRVGQSSVRRRHAAALPLPEAIGLPDVEPALVPALLALPETQRTAVWLVHACGWRYSEVAAAMETSTSMVGNHVSRGLAALRQRLGVAVDA
jgi:DNA-directed RNA polymerase specialized sigma24 family protein